MGMFLPDHHVGGILDQLNLRFAPGDSIAEMSAAQKEFKMFSDDHALSRSFGLLNVGPAGNWRTRRGFYKYLDDLKSVGFRGEAKAENGHDGLVATLADHLGKENAEPIHFSLHDREKDPNVVVHEEPRQSVFYSKNHFLSISLPVAASEGSKLQQE